MSLVQVIITKKFALVCGDMRSVDDQDNIINENFNKVIKLNKEIIFGCTGNIKDNFKLFDGYCYLHKHYGFVNSEKSFDNISYIDFVNIIVEKFNKMTEEHKDNENNIRYNIKSTICGFNGQEFEATNFLMIDDKSFKPQIKKLIIHPNNPCDIATLGEFSHDDNLRYLILKENPITIRQYKNILQTNFDYCSKTNVSINNICHFEQIRINDLKNEKI